LRDRVECAVQLQQFERRLRGRFRNRLKRSITYADPALSNASGKNRRDDFDLNAVHFAKQRGNQRDLLQPLAGLRDSARSFDHGRQQHAV
jgi:hypothetical protein